MIRNDRAILVGAWTIILGIGVFGVWRTAHQPKVDPSVVALAARVDAALRQSTPRLDPAPRLAYVHPGRIWSEPYPLPHALSSWTGFRYPRLEEVAVRKQNIDVFLLPLAVPSGAVDLDGPVLKWTLAEAKVALPPHMIRKAAKPAGFAIERQCEDGPAERIAELGPDARSYTDLAAEPNRTYRYWVLVRGEESDLAAETPERKPVLRSLSDSVELRPPSPHRVTLMGGGDRGSALLKVESYDRTHKKWIGRNVTALPGKAIGASGWTLVRLRLDGFYLVADVTDDDGVERILSTRK